MSRSLLPPRISEQFSRDKDGREGTRGRMERSKEKKDTQRERASAPVNSARSPARFYERREVG